MARGATLDQRIVFETYVPGAAHTLRGYTIPGAGVSWVEARILLYNSIILHDDERLANNTERAGCVSAL